MSDETKPKNLYWKKKVNSEGESLLDPIVYLSIISLKLGTLLQYYLQVTGNVGWRELLPDIKWNIQNKNESLIS